MSDGRELLTAETWLYSRLTADATLAALGVHTDDVPPGASYPNVQIRLNSATPRMVISDDIIKHVMLYVVVLVYEFRTGPYSWQPMAANVGRIQTQLHQQAGAVAGMGTVHRCSYEQAVRLAYENNGIHYREWGGLYRIELTSAS